MLKRSGEFSKLLKKYVRGLATLRPPAFFGFLSVLFAYFCTPSAGNPHHYCILTQHNAENPHHYWTSAICTSKQLPQHTQNPHHYCTLDHVNPTHHSHAKPKTSTTTALQPKPLPHRQQRHTTCRKPPISKPSG